MIALFGLIELLLAIPFLLIGLAATAFWIWMLIDCAINEPNNSNDKIVWVLIILFTHLIGALIYFFVRRPRRISVGGA